MNPIVTIIIPAYNAARFLPEALASLCAQSEQGWQAVVVDDGSTDGTTDLASSHGDPRIKVITQGNRGVSAARNRGLAEVNTPYVMFLDADDYLLPDAVARLTGALAAYPSLAAAYGEGLVIDEDGQVIGGGAASWNHRPSGDVLEPLLKRNFILCGALCARAEKLQLAGSFREELRLYEDWELWCRLAMTGPFHYLGGSPVLAYRRTDGGAVGSYGHEVTLARASLDVVFAHPTLATRFDAAARARLRRQSEASVHSFTASQHLKRHDWTAARAALLQSLRRHPAQRREWILLACAVLGWLPGPVSRRIK